MTKKVATLILVLLTLQHPRAQTGAARIFFVDIGQGAGTLIVSPAGRTLLVDGGPPGGGTKITSLLDTLGIATIDYTVLTHYHIDHDSGLTELLNAGRVAGIVYDNGDGLDVQPPGTATSATSTRGAYLNYVAATAHPGVTRQTIVPGQVIDLGGGMKATCLAAGGRLLTGAAAQITNQDLNSESISLLVEYNDFDFLVSGDLTGGGSTTTAKTADVETYVGQLAGDVDVLQLNHHGSTTTSNRTFLSAVKAEVAVAQAGTANTFGHPNRETANKYLNTPVTSGNVFPGTGLPAPGVGPVFYQHEESPPDDDRVTRQGYSGASAADAGRGTILLQTDGTTTYILESFDDGGVRINPAQHIYAVDGASPGITTDFPPTVIVQTTPVAPLASEPVVISAAVNDRESPIASVTLTYALDGVAQPTVGMTLAGTVYQATIPAQPDGTRVDFAVSGTTGAQTTTYSSGYFSGTTLVSALRATNALGEPLFTGYAARIHGTVAAGSNTFAAGTNDDYVQDATADDSGLHPGINVFRSSDTVTPFASTTPGQEVEVVGRIGFNGGRQRLDITESVEKTTTPYGITVLSSGPAPVPVPVTIAVLGANPESYEGQLVSIAGCQIVSGTLPITPQSVDTFVTIGDGTGTFTLKIDHDTDIEGFNPGTTFTAIGIIQQDDFLRPFDSGYDIAPRGRPDLGGAAAGTTPISIADARIDVIDNVDGTPGADFVPDLLNQLVKIRGAVTSIDFRGGNGVEYYVQDATAGIDLFNSTQNFGPFSVGDSIEAVGLVTQFNGLTELTVSSVTPLPPGTVPDATPQLVTLSQLGDGGAGEALEGRLIRIDNVTIASGAFPAANADGNLTITDATGSATLRIDRDTDIDGTPTPTGTLSIVGVLGQFDSSAPFDSGYQLFPRSLADIMVGGASAITATPASFDFGAVATGGESFTTITIANTSASSVTLTVPFTIAGVNADQFAVSAPAATVLASGSSTPATVTFHPTSTQPAVKSATLNVGSSDGAATVALTGTAQAGGGGPGTPVVISELRFRGPSGGNDEFVEIYNNTDGPIDIGGWKMNGSNNAGTVSTRATIPTGTALPARRHYLFTNSGASGYSGSVPGNTTYGTGITDDGGVALLKPDNSIVDQVGLSAGSAYKEGTPLASLGASNLNRGYERKPGGANGSGQDTNDNASDFQLLTPSDPQDLASAPTPGIAVSPSSIGFGSIVAGSVTSVTMTISAASPLVLAPPFVVSGTNSSDFFVGLPSTTTIGAGNDATVNVGFQPTTVGPKSASLLVASVDGGSQTVSLSGNAVCPAITISGSLPDGVVAVPYSQSLTGSGGTASYTFVVASGNLAPGLVLGNDGTVSGSPTAAGSFSAVVQATDVNGCQGTAPFSVTVHRTLRAGGSAKIWIGQKNSDGVGLRLDVRAEVLVNGVVAASGELDNISAGGSGFKDAILQTVALSLPEQVEVASGAVLSVQASARRTCFAGGHNSGTARAWFNGSPVDSGSGRDAGSRVTLTIGGAANIYFLRSAFELDTTAGTMRQSADAAVNGRTPCPARPFQPFGTWSVAVP